MTRSEAVLELEVGCIEQTHHVAATMAGVVPAGCVIGLQGDLGAGKTAFASGFVGALPGGARARVSSPTWAVMQEYPTTPRVRHLDLYRLETLEDLEGTGLEDLEEGVLLVEWPDRISAMMDLLDVLVFLGAGPDGPPAERRTIRIEGRSGGGRAVVQELTGRLAST